MGEIKSARKYIIYSYWNIIQSKNGTHIPIIKLWRSYVTPKSVQLWTHGWTNKIKYQHNQKNKVIIWGNRNHGTPLCEIPINLITPEKN